MLRLGFDIGGSSIKAALIVDEKILHQISAPFVHGMAGKELVRVLRDMAALLQSEAGVNRRPEMVGAAAPGSFSQGGELLLHAYNLGWHDFPLANLVREAFPTAAVRTANDANAAAWGEYRAGALRGCECGLLLTLGTGLGCGAIIQGRLFNGGRNSGCEAGHVRLGYEQGPVCTCGEQGCAEAYLSAAALVGLARGRGLPAEEAREVAEAAASGDARALSAWDAYRSSLVAFLASLVNILDPELIAIGGGLAESGKLLFAGLEREVGESCFFGHCGPIVPAQLGPWAGAVGVALL